MEKKGELQDIIVFVITLFVLACGLLILLYVSPLIFNGLKTAGLNNSETGARVIEDSIDVTKNTINNGYMLLFVGLVISMMITSFMVRTHPIFLFLYIIILMITVVLSIYLGNHYYQLEQNPIFEDALNDGSFIHLIMNHLVEVTIAIGILSMIIVFSKFSSGGSPTQF